MLELQKFIENNQNWEEKLTNEPYYLTIKKEKISEYEYYVIFKYNMLNSDFNEKIVQEARGIIFQINYKVNLIKPVCIPFFKFFNYGEENAAKLDEKTTKFLEKKDGTLIKLWYNLNEWHWSTNNTIFAKNAIITNTNLTFYDIIIKSKEYYYINQLIQNNELNTNLTYMFELTSIVTKLVVPYEGTHLTFLSARNNITLKEQDYDFKEFQEKIPRPKLYNINTLQTAIEVVKNFPFTKEGFVAVDKDYNRIKIKSPAYIRASYLRINGTITPKRIIDIIQQHEEKEFLNYYPIYQNDFNNIQQKYKQLENLIKETIVELITKPVQSSYEICQRYNNEPLKKYLALNWWKNEIILNWISHYTTEELLKIFEQLPTKETEL